MGNVLTAGLLTLALIAMAAPCVGDSTADSVQEINYAGIRPSDIGGSDGLRNPERGFRTETLIAEDPHYYESMYFPKYLKGRTIPDNCDDRWIFAMDHYASCGLTLAQMYCYLDQFIDKPIGKQKLDRLQKSFDRLRQKGGKAILRFAYERDMDKSKGPTTDRILQHIDQLEPIIRKNSDVILVMEAGFVGAWGEWHSSKHGIENDHHALARIVSKILTILPQDRMTQVRVPKYKRWVLDDPILGGFRTCESNTAHTNAPEARIGFHNDGVLAGKTHGYTWTEPPILGATGNPEFDYMTKESPYVYVDGELFYSNVEGAVDGLQAAEYLRLHHFTSLSIEHSNCEYEGAATPESIDNWMATAITKEQLQAAKLPVSNDYFEDAQGKPVARTQFEYIRDHLGYRLELQKAVLPKKARAGSRMHIDIALVNRGFSTIHNPRPVKLALIDGDRHVTVLPVLNVDPRVWQPFRPGDQNYTPLIHHIAADITLPEGLAPGWYHLGLWLPDAAKSIEMDPRYAIRVANRAIPWWTDDRGHFGINVIGTLEIAKQPDPDGLRPGPQ